MKKSAAVVMLAVAVASAAAGCSAAAVEQPQPRPVGVAGVPSESAVQPATEATSEPTPTAEPLPATFVNDEGITVNVERDEDAYLNVFQAVAWRGGPHPGDRQLIAYGDSACAQMASGVPRVDVHVTGGTGDDDHLNNVRISIAAAQYLCGDIY